MFRVILVSIFLHSYWIWRDSEYLSGFSLNAGKCRPELLWIQTFSRSDDYIWIDALPFLWWYRLFDFASVHETLQLAQLSRWVVLSVWQYTFFNKSLIVLFFFFFFYLCCIILRQYIEHLVSSFRQGWTVISKILFGNHLRFSNTLKLIYSKKPLQNRRNILSLM